MEKLQQGKKNRRYFMYFFKFKVFVNKKHIRTNEHSISPGYLCEYDEFAEKITPIEIVVGTNNVCIFFLESRHEKK